MKILITGVAGFIGMNTAHRLLFEKHRIIGIDNINDYYDQNLKLNRINQLNSFDNFEFIKADILDSKIINEIFEENRFDIVIHYAAQAGVRYSSQNPHAFVDNNIKGLLNILEACKHFATRHLIFASSSSVYGLNSQVPFSEAGSTDRPASLYGALKRSGELMLHSYSHMYQLQTTCLRFFTVYGPWGRPDQALALFLDAAFSGRPVQIFNNGMMLRDLTYIDDAVEAVCRVINKETVFNLDQTLPPSHLSKQDLSVPFRVFNVGASQPVQLLKYIEIIEEELGFRLMKEYFPAQDGDMVATHSDTTLLEQWIDFKPATSIHAGVRKYITWYREYYKI